MKLKQPTISLMLTAALLTSSVSFVPATVYAAEDDPAYVTKQVHVYRESMDEDETMECRFYEDLPNIPYVEFTSYYAQIFDGKSTVEKTADHTYTVTMLPDGDKAVLDTENDSMAIDNSANFLATPDYAKSNFAEQTKEEAPYLEFVSIEYDPQQPALKTLAFGDYGIDIREEDGKVYFPVATLSDMFSGDSYTTVHYNGENLYLNEYEKMMNGENAKDKDSHYADYFLENDRSEEMAAFNYCELCFNLDNWYGYPMLRNTFTSKMKEVGIDKALTEMYPEIRTSLLSTNNSDYLFGFIQLMSLVLADGGHTSFPGIELYTTASEKSVAMVTELSEKLESMYSQVESNEYLAKQLETMSALIGCSITRAMVFSGIADYDDFNDEDKPVEEYPEEEYPTEEYPEDYDPESDYTPEEVSLAELYKGVPTAQVIEEMGSYHASGDTAMISFDAFQIDADGLRDYFAGKGDLPVWDDTFSLVTSCLKMAKEDSNIKNIVFDISSNSGGDTYVLAGLCGVILDKPSFNFIELNTQQKTTYNFKVDKNLDGTIDEKDDEVDYSDYNFAVLTSRASFSCANAFASVMKDNGKMIMGEQSGGGSCAVFLKSTADGFTYTMSGNLLLTNASGENIDDGVALDLNLIQYYEDGYKDYREFYNLNALSPEIHKFYGTTPAAPEQSEESKDENSITEHSTEISIVETSIPERSNETSTVTISTNEQSSNVSTTTAVTSQQSQNSTTTGSSAGTQNTTESVPATGDRSTPIALIFMITAGLFGAFIAVKKKSEQ